MMRAYEIRQFGIDDLTLNDREIPRPGHTGVLVRIKAVSLNYRDRMVVEGTYNPRMKLPAVPFSDASGEVTEVGKGVTRWKVGDCVMPIFAQGWLDGQTSQEKRLTSLGAGAQWDGVLREYAVFDEQGLVEVPDHLSYEEAATLPCAALTAWHALAESVRLRAGESVLTLGTGGVSVFAVQIAKLFGARVIATSSSDEKLSRLAELGADETINYRSSVDWEKAVLELTGRQGVDHVVEVGGAGTLPRSIASVRVGGHIALIGALTGAVTFDPISVFMKAIRLQGIFVGSRTMFEDMNKAFAVNKVKPVIDRVFSFDEVREALHYMADGSHFGKIVVRVDEA